MGECSGVHPTTARMAQDEGGVLVVLISGPIASGKSALGRAVAGRLDEVPGSGCAVIDLDLVYEMLDPRRRPKSDQQCGQRRGALLPEWRACCWVKVAQW